MRHWRTTSDEQNHKEEDWKKSLLRFDTKKLQLNIY